MNHLMNSALYEELKFSWKRKIANAIFEQKTQKEMNLNFDQTALGFTAPNRSTFTGKEVHYVPSANVDDKRQITATFCVNIVGDFLPVQLIYGGVTDKCHPQVKFPESFHITHSQNHWSNEDILMVYLKKIIFIYIKSKHQALKLPENAKALLIFDVFKGQTTSAVTDLLKKNDIIAMHVPNNQANMFQPLEMSVNKSAKCFIADKYQDWYAEKGLQQLNRSVAAHDVKVDVKLSIMKPLPDKWIIEIYHHLKRCKHIVNSGFRKAHITETVNEADQLAQLCQSQFAEIFLVSN